LHMVFKPETLDIYAEDESKRANAFRMYVSARIRPSIIGEMLQLDLPDGMEYSALDEMFDKPEVDKPVSPLINPGEAPAQVPVTTGFGKALQLDAGMIKDLALWKDIAVRCFRKNKGAAVDFECKALMEEYAAPIRKALAGARDEADIIKAFDISGPDTDSQQSEADNVVKAMYLEVMALKAQKVG
jgi:hypothetical protein